MISGQRSFLEGDSQVVKEYNEAEARAWRLNSLLAMQRILVSAEPGSRELTIGRMLEGLVGSWPYKSLKGERLMNLW